MDINILHDVPYGSHERHKIDIFIPENIKSDSGIFLFIHGGGWNEGDKSIHHADSQYFCNLGYICATMNYRFVADDISVFDELDDITSALKILKQKCLKYGVNAEKLILSGGSAGGHLSLLYAYTRKEEAPVKPVAVCAYAPPVNCAKPDFLYGISSEFDEWKYGLLSKCCGFRITKDDFLNQPQQEALCKISPDNYVTSYCVPTAVFHGRYDDLIPLKYAEDFIKQLNKAGVKNDFLIYENSDHLLKKDPDTASKAKDIIKNYAEKYF